MILIIFLVIFILIAIVLGVLVITGVLPILSAPAPAAVPAPVPVAVPTPTPAPIVAPVPAPIVLPTIQSFPASSPEAPPPTPTTTVAPIAPIVPISQIAQPAQPTPPPTLPSDINFVKGWSGAHENPGNKVSGPEECRQLALNSNGKYVAWGFRTDSHSDPNMRNTCFLYTSDFGPFSGNPNDNAHLTGCLRPEERVEFGCKTEPPRIKGCENQSANLICPAGQVISDAKIKYGRFNLQDCKDHVTINSGTPLSSKDYTLFNAIGNQNFSISNFSKHPNINEDPAPMIFKHWEIDYKCNVPNAVKKPEFFSIQHNAGKCFHPHGGSPDATIDVVERRGSIKALDTTKKVGTKVVLWDGCNEPRLNFRFTPKGSLQHRTSNKCLHPSGVGDKTPPDDTRLVFWDGCDEPRLEFKFLDNGSLQHVASGKCVHPFGGKSNPDSGTDLVLYTGCDEPSGRLKFNQIFTS